MPWPMWFPSAPPEVSSTQIERFLLSPFMSGLEKRVRRLFSENMIANTIEHHLEPLAVLKGFTDRRTIMEKPRHRRQ